MLPDGVDNEVKAAYGNGYATSFYALRDRGKLHPGETLLVHDAGGGVGLAAVYLGRAASTMPLAEALVMAKQLNSLLMTSGKIDAAAEQFEQSKKP